MTNEAASDGANGTVTIAGQTVPADTQTTAADTAAGGEGASDDGAWRNMGEIKKALANQRELDRIIRSEVLPRLQNMTAAPNGKPTAPHRAAEPASDVDAMRAELASLRRETAAAQAFADLGVKPGPQRELLEMAIKSQQPEDVREFITRYHGALRPPAPTVIVPPATITPAGAPTNTGAPSATARQELSGSPLALTHDQVRAMTPEQIREHYRHWRNKSAANYNPTAAKVLNRYAASKQ